VTRNPADFLRGIIGQTIWHVNAGGVTWPSFSLALGGKVPRQRPLKNPAVSDEFRENAGEMAFLVWSTWRLEMEDEIVATSAQSDLAASKLEELKGLSVEEVVCISPAWDVVVRFSNARILRLFCDHLAPMDGVDTNWELCVRGEQLCVGPGAFFEFDAAI